ncbi:hypothetical protein BBK14_02035 [Parafrankia soli]|uniref:Uncharacterized protein n=1 Tax=Parafrankia soli TaxID=2599596 RepID=A0A1S1RKD5_9ACTN|nr:hypothetical protein [Parafrankia soli]OHV46650.1 hypothetical protein BBK14_02035 [Parafrankia soli]
MTGPYHLAATQSRATATMTLHRTVRPAPLVGLMVLDEQSQPTRIVGPFASETTARQWAAENRVTAYQLWPLEVPGRRS